LTLDLGGQAELGRTEPVRAFVQPSSLVALRLSDAGNPTPANGKILEGDFSFQVPDGVREVCRDDTGPGLAVFYRLPSRGGVVFLYATQLCGSCSAARFGAELTIASSGSPTAGEGVQ
jgi:hypothetical protein